MSYSSCIRQPEKNRYIQLHEWQKEFCQGNHCAAFLLSFFINWHDWKTKNDQYYRRYNDIAEAHGDGRPHNENAYLFFTMNDFVDAMMGLFGKKTISEGLDLLVSLCVITVHKNPNPRYHFDKTKYFKFYPEVCNEWIQDNYPLIKNEESDAQVIDNFDNAEIDNRSRKNALPSSKNDQPSRKSGQAITYKTNNTTNINKPLNTRDDSEKQKSNAKLSCDTELENALFDQVIDVLQQNGFPSERFQYDDVKESMHELINQGATVEDFVSAHEKIKRSKGDQPFAASYLIKAVQSYFSSNQKTKLGKNIAPVSAENSTDLNHEHEINDLSNLNWLTEYN